MIISRTPFRVSFFGGGTDYPDWYRENGGSVLATTINRYCYISVRHLPPFFEHKTRAVYSKIENVSNHADISHPSIKAVLKVMKIDDGLEIHHDGDLPARSGLGSSSSFTVGLINALKALKGEMITKNELATKAIFIEQNVIEENVGSQDQVAVAYGGFNRINFEQDDTFQVSPLIFRKQKKDELQNHLMLFFTGLTRFSSDVAQTKISNFKNRKSELKVMQSMVDESISILQSETTPITKFGELLDESWKLKKSLSDAVSTSHIDEIYKAGIDAGASGGKLLGAGGGGFMLFFVRPENQPKVREQLKSLVNVSFKFDNEGSRIVVYDPQI